MSKYGAAHPGGKAVLEAAAGKDVTLEWLAIHSKAELETVLAEWRVGELDASLGGDTELDTVPEGSSKSKCAFRAQKVLDCVVASTRMADEQTLEMTIKLPRDSHTGELDVATLTLGGHVVIVAKVDRPGIQEKEEISRAYTPLKTCFDTGNLQMLIKVYNPTMDYPLGGAMSQHLMGLKVNDRISIRGSKGELMYLGRGCFKRVGDGVSKASNIGFVCGGSGITPALQIIQAILEDEHDSTTAWLLYSNKTEKDIMARGLIDALAEKHPKRFVRWYTLTQGSRPPGWGYSMGRINVWMMSMFMPRADHDSLVTLCGPTEFVHDCCVPLSEGLGHTDEHIHVF